MKQDICDWPRGVSGGQSMRERDIEARLAAEVRKRGGLCWKFVSPGNNGVPDRIVVTPDGRTVYVELKTRAGRLSALQAHQIRELSRRGADVRVLKGLEEVLDFVEEVTPDEVCTAQLPALCHRAHHLGPGPGAVPGHGAGQDGRHPDGGERPAV